MNLLQEARLKQQEQEQKKTTDSMNLLVAAGLKPAPAVEQPQPAQPQAAQPQPAPQPTPRGASPRATRAAVTRLQADTEREQQLSQLTPEVRREVESTGALKAGLIGLGKGFSTVGRGLGLMEPETPEEQQAMGALEVAYPASTTVGEIAGEALPFVPVGVGAGALTTKLGGGIGARILAGGAVGGLEGGVITRGGGGSPLETAAGAGIGAAIGGVMEAVIPVIGRIAKKVYQKINKKMPAGALVDNAGRPTPEFKAAMDEAGLSEDQLNKEIVEILRKNAGADPQQAARMARFEAQGIPYTQGDITQKFGDVAAEQRYLQMTTGEQSEPLRQLKAAQSDAFSSKINEIVSALGVPDESGDAIKNALTGREKMLRSEKNAIYRQVAELKPETSRIPVAIDDIKRALPDADTIDDIAVTAESSVEKLKLALARFGIDQSEQALTLLEKKGLQAQPLTMANFDRFRKMIGNIERGDETGAIKVLTGPLKSALDNETDLIADALTKSGAMTEDIAQKLKDARGIVRQMKTEFSPDAITGKLIDVKKDGVTPVIEASQVGKKLLAKGTPIEHLERTIQSLEKSGADGRAAIRNLQASAVLDVLEKSFTGVSYKYGGTPTMSTTQFVKAMRDLEPKLPALFKDNPETLAKLRGFVKTARDITPDNRTVPKGSERGLLDLANAILASKFVGPAASAAKGLFDMSFKASGDARKIRRALKAKPDMLDVATRIEKEFPAIAGAFGISAALQDEEQQ